MLKNLHPGLTHTQKWLLNLLLLLTLGLLLAGLSMPMLTMTQLLFFDNTFSVVSGVLSLFERGYFVLAALVAAFSVMLPVLKLAVLFRILNRGQMSVSRLQRYLHLMHEYGRWAMLDVLVVAVLIVMVKLGAFASIQVHLGLYLFAASVLMIMLLTGWIVRLSGNEGRMPD